MNAERPPGTTPVRRAPSIRRAWCGLAIVMLVGVGLAQPADAAISRDRAATPSSKAASKASKATKPVPAPKATAASRASSRTVGAASVRVGASASLRAGARADRRAGVERPGRGTSERAPARSSSRLAARQAPRFVAPPPRPSIGQLAGLHATEDPLDLKSSVALVVDQETGDVLLSKNPDAVLPIASLTKLMTALVVAETAQPLDETLTITEADIDTEKGSRSRLSIGTRLTRGEMLHLALMSSENRAANALGRHYPGGLRAFVSAMNAKAQLLGMSDTEYVEPTGLSSRNRSSARDLALLVEAASRHETIRELSTSTGMQVDGRTRPLAFHNTNRLVHSPDWEIGLQKTGFISEAGRCLVMQAQVAGRSLIMVFLDSAGRHSRLGDAERVRQWVAAGAPVASVRDVREVREARIDAPVVDREATAGPAAALATTAEPTGEPHTTAALGAPAADL